jgi:hypothetical protein
VKVKQGLLGAVGGMGFRVRELGGGKRWCMRGEGGATGGCGGECAGLR